MRGQEGRNDEVAEAVQEDRKQRFSERNAESPGQPAHRATLGHAGRDELDPASLARGVRRLLV